jgi:hypothetical protein
MSNARTRPPAPAHVAFQARKAELQQLSLAERFSQIFTTNLWTGGSRSGLGSELTATTGVRAELPALLTALDARTLLDLPCGDFGWLSTVPLDLEYIGGDIVTSIIAENTRRYGGAGTRRRFLRLDLTTDPLPRADVVLCRDCLVHLSFANIARAFDNLWRSGSTYLIATTFLEHEQNEDIEDGDWRLLNLTRPPLNLPLPEMVLLEGCLEGDGAYADKALGVWRMGDL